MTDMTPQQIVDAIDRSLRETAKQFAPAKKKHATESNVQPQAPQRQTAKGRTISKAGKASA